MKTICQRQTKVHLFAIVDVLSGNSPIGMHRLSLDCGGNIYGVILLVNWANCQEFILLFVVGSMRSLSLISPDISQDADCGKKFFVEWAYLLLDHILHNINTSTFYQLYR